MECVESASEGSGSFSHQDVYGLVLAFGGSLELLRAGFEKRKNNAFNSFSKGLLTFQNEAIPLQTE